jgi:hypothetical protein
MADPDTLNCGFSGVAANPDAIIFPDGDDDEPQVLGWVEITLRRTVENPEWHARQAFAAAAFELAWGQTQAQMQAQDAELNDEELANARDFIARTAESQHFAYCNAVPRYLTSEETSWCMDPLAATKQAREVRAEFERWCGTAGVPVPWSADDEPVQAPVVKKEAL